MSAGTRTRRAILAAIAAAALAAGCSAGSTPPLPTVPPSSSSPAVSSSAPPAPGCSDKDRTRVQSYAPSPAANGTAGRVAAIRARGHLNVGVSADNLLFGYRNPFTGQLEGFDIDIANEVAKAIFGTRGHVEYVVENFAQRIPDLQSDKVDMVADIMTINCARWGQIAFSAEYFHAGQQVLVRTNAPYTSIQDLNGKKVCTAKGSTGNENLKNRFPQVQREVVETISDCMVLFQQGSIEGIVSDNTVLNGFASQDPYAHVVGPQFTSEPYGLGFNKADVDFVRYVNALLDKWRTDGTWVTIYHKWLPGPVSNPPPAVYGRALP